MEEVLENLKEEMMFYRNSIRKITLSILEKQITKYPIFVAHQNDIGLGQKILDNEIYHTNWSISVSAMEEFVDRKLIQENKIEDFKSVYKDPNLFFCVFFIYEEEASFIFIPYTDPIKN